MVESSCLFSSVLTYIAHVRRHHGKVGICDGPGTWFSWDSPENFPAMKLLSLAAQELSTWSSSLGVVCP